MLMRTTLLALAAISFAAVYRFASHGIRLKDNRCIGLACIALTVAVLSSGYTFWSWRRQRDRAPRP